MPFATPQDVTAQGRPGEPADGADEGGRVQGPYGAPGPVPAGVEALKDGAAKQDVHPGVQDLVPGGEANEEQQVVDPEWAPRKHSLCNKHLWSVRGRREERGR